MTDWMIWFALAGILVAAEIFTGTFYLLMIAVGFCAGGIAAVAGVPFYGQFIAAGISGGVVTLALRNSRLFKKHRVHPQRNPSVLLDIGQTVEVRQWENPQNGIYPVAGQLSRCSLGCGTASGRQAGSRIVHHS